MQANQLANVPLGSFTWTLVGLFQKGVRYATVIDVGCADGHFYVHHHQLGLFPGSAALNIDPNPIYEDSLKAIKEVMGGHYAIAAASDREYDGAEYVWPGEPLTDPDGNPLDAEPSW